MWRGLVLAILLLPATARAQELVDEELRLLPEYTSCMVSGVRYACYTNEGQAQLNALEVETLGLRRQVQISEGLHLELDQLVANLERQNAERDAIIALFTTQVAELNLQLGVEIEAKNRYRAEAESGPDLWPLILGAVVACLGLGVGAGLAISAL